MINRILLICLILFFSGCLLFSSEPPAYRSTIDIHNRSQNEITTGIRNRLISLGWRILERRSRVGHIVAATNETTAMRDVLLMDISQSGEIKLWIRSEIIMDGHWFAPDCVCLGYTYFREQALLQELIH